MIALVLPVHLANPNDYERNIETGGFHPIVISQTSTTSDLRTTSAVLQVYLHNVGILGNAYKLTSTIHHTKDNQSTIMFPTCHPMRAYDGLNLIRCLF